MIFAFLDNVEKPVRNSRPSTATRGSGLEKRHTRPRRVPALDGMRLHLGTNAASLSFQIVRTDQNKIPNSLLSNSSSGIMVSASGASGARVATASCTMASFVIGAMRMVRTTS